MLSNQRKQGPVISRQASDEINSDQLKIQLLSLSKDGMQWKSNNQLEEGEKSLQHKELKDHFLVDPVEVEGVNEKVVKIQTNSSIQLLLTESGKVLSRGVDAQNNGILGLGEGIYQSKEFQEIESLSNVKIQNISLGTTHAGAIDDEGNLYMWGKGTNGQLAQLNSSTESMKEIFEDSPFLVDMQDLAKNSREVLCQSSFTTVLTKQGQIIVLGEIEENKTKSLKLILGKQSSNQLKGGQKKKLKNQITYSWQTFIKLGSQGEWGGFAITKKGDIVFYNKYFMAEKLGGKTQIKEAFALKDKLYALQEEGLLEWDLGFLLKNGFFSSNQRSNLDRKLDTKFYPPKFFPFTQNVRSSRFIISPDSNQLVLCLCNKRQQKILNNMILIETNGGEVFEETAGLFNLAGKEQKYRQNSNDQSKLSNSLLNSSVKFNFNPNQSQSSFNNYALTSNLLKSNQSPYSFLQNNNEDWRHNIFSPSNNNPNKSYREEGIRTFLNANLPENRSSSNKGESLVKRGYSLAEYEKELNRQFNFSKNEPEQNRRHHLEQSYLNEDRNQKYKGLGNLQSQLNDFRDKLGGVGGDSSFSKGNQGFRGSYQNNQAIRPQSSTYSSVSHLSKSNLRYQCLIKTIVVVESNNLAIEKGYDARPKRDTSSSEFESKWNNLNLKLDQRVQQSSVDNGKDLNYFMSLISTGKDSLSQGNNYQQNYTDNGRGYLDQNRGGMNKISYLNDMGSTQNNIQRSTSTKSLTDGNFVGNSLLTKSQAHGFLDSFKQFARQNEQLRIDSASEARNSLNLLNNSSSYKFQPRQQNLNKSLSIQNSSFSQSKKFTFIDSSGLQISSHQNQFAPRTKLNESLSNSVKHNLLNDSAQSKSLVKGQFDRLWNNLNKSRDELNKSNNQRSHNNSYYSESRQKISRTNSAYEPLQRFTSDLNHSIQQPRKSYLQGTSPGGNKYSNTLSNFTLKDDFKSRSQGLISTSRGRLEGFSDQGGIRSSNYSPSFLKKEGNGLNRNGSQNLNSSINNSFDKSNLFKSRRGSFGYEAEETGLRPSSRSNLGQYSKEDKGFSSKGGGIFDGKRTNNDLPKSGRSLREVIGNNTSSTNQGFDNKKSSRRDNEEEDQNELTDQTELTGIYKNKNDKAQSNSKDQIKKQGEKGNEKKKGGSQQGSENQTTLGDEEKGTTRTMIESLKSDKNLPKSENQKLKNNRKSGTPIEGEEGEGDDLLDSHRKDKTQKSTNKKNLNNPTNSHFEESPNQELDFDKRRKSKQRIDKDGNTLLTDGSILDLSCSDDNDSNEIDIQSLSPEQQQIRIKRKQEQKTQQQQKNKSQRKNNNNSSNNNNNQDLDDSEEEEDDDDQNLEYLTPEEAEKKIARREERKKQRLLQGGDNKRKVKSKKQKTGSQQQKQNSNQQDDSQEQEEDVDVEELEDDEEDLDQIDLETLSPEEQRKEINRRQQRKQQKLQKKQRVQSKQAKGVHQSNENALENSFEEEENQQVQFQKNSRIEQNKGQKKGEPSQQKGQLKNKINQYQNEEEEDNDFQNADQEQMNLKNQKGQQKSRQGNNLINQQQRGASNNSNQRSGDENQDNSFEQQNNEGYDQHQKEVKSKSSQRKQGGIKNINDPNQEEEYNDEQEYEMSNNQQRGRQGSSKNRGSSQDNDRISTSKDPNKRENSSNNNRNQNEFEGNKSGSRNNSQGRSVQNGSAEGASQQDFPQNQKDNNNRSNNFQNNNNRNQDGIQGNRTGERNPLSGQNQKDENYEETYSDDEDRIQSQGQPNSSSNKYKQGNKNQGQNRRDQYSIKSQERNRNDQNSIPEEEGSYGQEYDYDNQSRNNGTRGVGNQEKIRNKSSEGAYKNSIGDRQIPNNQKNSKDSGIGSQKSIKGQAQNNNLKGSQFGNDRNNLSEEEKIALDFKVRKEQDQQQRINGSGLKGEMNLNLQEELENNKRLGIGLEYQSEDPDLKKSQLLTYSSLENFSLSPDIKSKITQNRSPLETNQMSSGELSQLKAQKSLFQDGQLGNSQVNSQSPFNLKGEINSPSKQQQYLQNSGKQGQKLSNFNQLNHPNEYIPSQIPLNLSQSQQFGKSSIPRQQQTFSTDQKKVGLQSQKELLRQSLDPSILRRQNSKQAQDRSKDKNNLDSSKQSINSKSSIERNPKRSSSLRYSNICQSFEDKMRKSHYIEKTKAIERVTGTKLSHYGDVNRSRSNSQMNNSVTNRSSASLNRSLNPLRKAGLSGSRFTPSKDILPQEIKSQERKDMNYNSLRNSKSVDNDAYANSPDGRFDSGRNDNVNSIYDKQFFNSVAANALSPIPNANKGYYNSNNFMNEGGEQILQGEQQFNNQQPQNNLKKQTESQEGKKVQTLDSDNVQQIQSEQKVRLPSKSSRQSTLNSQRQVNSIEQVQKKAPSREPSPLSNKPSQQDLRASGGSNMKLSGSYSVKQQNNTEEKERIEDIGVQKNESMKLISVPIPKKKMSEELYSETSKQPKKSDHQVQNVIKTDEEDRTLKKNKSGIQNQQEKQNQDSQMTIDELRGSNEDQNDERRKKAIKKQQQDAIQSIVYPQENLPSQTKGITPTIQKQFELQNSTSQNFSPTVSVNFQSSNQLLTGSKFFQQKEKSPLTSISSNPYPVAQCQDSSFEELKEILDEKRNQILSEMNPLQNTLQNQSKKQITQSQQQIANSIYNTKQSINPKDNEYVQFQVQDERFQVLRECAISNVVQKREERDARIQNLVKDSHHTSFVEDDLKYSSQGEELVQSHPLVYDTGLLPIPKSTRLSPTRSANQEDMDKEISRVAQQIQQQLTDNSIKSGLSSKSNQKHLNDFGSSGLAALEKVIYKPQDRLSERNSNSYEKRDLKPSTSNTSQTYEKKLEFSENVYQTYKSKNPGLSSASLGRVNDEIQIQGDDYEERTRQGYEENNRIKVQQMYQDKDHNLKEDKKYIPTFGDQEILSSNHLSKKNDLVNPLKISSTQDPKLSFTDYKNQDQMKKKEKNSLVLSSLRQPQPQEQLPQNNDKGLQIKESQQRNEINNAQNNIPGYLQPSNLSKSNKNQASALPTSESNQNDSVTYKQSKRSILSQANDDSNDRQAVYNHSQLAPGSLESIGQISFLSKPLQSTSYQKDIEIQNQSGLKMNGTASGITLPSSDVVNRNSQQDQNFVKSVQRNNLEKIIGEQRQNQAQKEGQSFKKEMNKDQSITQLYEQEIKKQSSYSNSNKNEKPASNSQDEMKRQLTDLISFKQISQKNKICVVLALKAEKFLIRRKFQAFQNIKLQSFDKSREESNVQANIRFNNQEQNQTRLKGFNLLKAIEHLISKKQNQYFFEFIVKLRKNNLIARVKTLSSTSSQQSQPQKRSQNELTREQIQAIHSFNHMAKILKHIFRKRIQSAFECITVLNSSIRPTLDRNPFIQQLHEQNQINLETPNKKSKNSLHKATSDSPQRLAQIQQDNTRRSQQNSQNPLAGSLKNQYEAANERGNGSSYEETETNIKENQRQREKIQQDGYRRLINELEPNLESQNEKNVEEDNAYKPQHVPTYADAKEFEPDTYTKSTSNYDKEEQRAIDLLQKNKNLVSNSKQSGIKRLLHQGENPGDSLDLENQSQSEKNQRFEKYLTQFNITHSQVGQSNLLKHSTSSTAKENNLQYNFGDQEQEIDYHSLLYSMQDNLSPNSKTLGKSLNQSQQYCFIPENLQPGHVHKKRYMTLKVAPIDNYTDVKQNTLADKKLNQQSLYNPPAQYLPGYDRVIHQQKQTIGKKFQNLHNSQVTGKELSTSPNHVTLHSPNHSLAVSQSMCNANQSLNMHQSPRATIAMNASNRLYDIAVLKQQKQLQSTKQSRGDLQNSQNLKSSDNLKRSNKFK